MSDDAYIAHPLRARLDWLLSLVQELQDAGVTLPMGSYAEVYDVIEEARDTIAPDAFQETDLDAIDGDRWVWYATHRSRLDGSEARLIATSESGLNLLLQNENGDEWQDALSEWEPIQVTDAEWDALPPSVRDVLDPGSAS